MRFQVPQFIEVESKIFGPLTLKQFIFLLGGAGIVFVIYSFSGSFFLALIFGAPFAILALALAFYKVNNQPFVKILENAFNYFVSGKIYVWNKSEREKEKKTVRKEKGPVKQEPQIYMPALTENKLKDLAWSLNIKEKIK